MKFTQFNRIVEIRTKIISMGTFLTGSLFALATAQSWSWSRFLVMLLAVLFVDMGTTGFNSYFDFINGTDRAQYNLEKDKVLVHEGVSPSLALLISVTLFILAAILGLLLAHWTSYWLIPIGGVSMMVGFLYTGGPYPISRTPFGELFAGGFLGSLLFVLSYYVQTLTFKWSAIVVSLPLLLLIGEILMVNNSCDRIADEIAGRRTLAILLGEQKSVIASRSILLGALLIQLLLPLLGLIPMVTLPFTIGGALLALPIWIKMEKRGFSLETKGISMGGISKIYLIHCLFFGVALLISYF
ncbi:MAG TPA: UbiA family prenyltransferase [Spirochaetales bacterium]|nr:UbiA family prenyltransferase [Spirochaetales bacterium]